MNVVFGHLSDIRFSILYRPFSRHRAKSVTCQLRTHACKKKSRRPSLSPDERLPEAAPICAQDIHF